MFTLSDQQLQLIVLYKIIFVKLYTQDCLEYSKIGQNYMPLYAYTLLSIIKFSLTLHLKIILSCFEWYNMCERK